jgi:hypothetical protein
MHPRPRSRQLQGATGVTLGASQELRSVTGSGGLFDGAKESRPERASVTPQLPSTKRESVSAQSTGQLSIYTDLGASDESDTDGRSRSPSRSPSQVRRSRTPLSAVGLHRPASSAWSSRSRGTSAVLTSASSPAVPAVSMSPAGTVGVKETPKGSPSLSSLATHSLLAKVAPVLRYPDRIPMLLPGQSLAAAATSSSSTSFSSAAPPKEFVVKTRTLLPTPAPEKPSLLAKSVPSPAAAAPAPQPPVSVPLPVTISSSSPFALSAHSDLPDDDLPRICFRFLGTSPSPPRLPSVLLASPSHVISVHICIVIVMFSR